MLKLHQLYHPITATPYRRNSFYIETVPCAALRPYIRCFWGTSCPTAAAASSDTSTLVIPDTCMDIIFNVNYTENSYSASFCALDEKAYRTAYPADGACQAVFAVRFYAWSAILFSEHSLKDSHDPSFDAAAFSCGLQKELEPLLFDMPLLSDKIRMAEKVLLKRLNCSRQNDTLMNAVCRILSANGNIRISELQNDLVVSAKQLERIFSANMGIAPKSFAELIRYQKLWQDMVYSKDFHILDAVEKYGYFDQSHLLHDFKRRHLLLPAEALALARTK